MKDPIRILHVFAQMNRGGAETMIMNLYRNIDRSEIQFDFIVHTEEQGDFDEEIEQLGGRIYRIFRYSGKNHFAYKRAWENFLEQHPDYKLIHGHVRSTASIYLSIAKKRDILTIAHSHSIKSRGSWIERIIKDTFQLPIRYIADFYFACSGNAGEWLFGKKIIHNKNYYILKNAIEIMKYEYNESIRLKMRKELGIKNEILLGHVGSFTSPKNHRFLIEVFHQFQNIKDSKLLLVGSGVLKKDIQKQIHDLGMENKVLLVGSVPNVQDYMQAMDVFVFPSIFEGLGIAAIEAQASGLCTIVSEKLPEEIYLTSQITTISLEKSAQYWADVIAMKTNSCNRVDTYLQLKKQGYDVYDTAKWISLFYSTVIKKKNNQII